MKGQAMLFGEMPVGTHFQEFGKTPRKFIKLCQTFGGGDPFKVYRVVLGEDDKPKILDGHEINAVDYQGVGGHCPSHVEFQVISIP